ncbi:hypothetical protein FZ983_27625 [Azospirillum sp. B21]|uniref:hypothetical protein n=1 Tax=Azospirillum sp. B21 TaxID=2607496 RepID=UPI0011EBA055|nr:hypothetical protein [Azospirillum sp. B21]KAA0574672.1 hypothetical protein FZ983_27625 [Azospirillum sp. B21]
MFDMRKNFSAAASPAGLRRRRADARPAPPRRHRPGCGAGGLTLAQLRRGVTGRAAAPAGCAAETGATAAEGWS